MFVDASRRIIAVHRLTISEAKEARGRSKVSTFTNPFKDSDPKKSRGETVSNEKHVCHSMYSLLPRDVEGFESLVELALDLRWSWNHATDKVWSQLDPLLWEVSRNPWVVLQTVSREQIERVLEHPYGRNVDGLIKARRQALEGHTWFQLNHLQTSLTCAALFQHGIYVERSITHLLGRPWERRGRSA